MDEHLKNQQAIDPLDFIAQCPAGMANLGVVSFEDRPDQLEITIYVREDTSRINALDNPDVELRSTNMLVDGVYIAPLLVRIGKEKQENIFEMWLNFFASEKKIRLLGEQDRIVLSFVGDSRKVERKIKVKNSWRDYFEQLYKVCSVQQKWSMKEFDRAKQEMYAKYPAIMDLWQGIGDIG